MYDSARNLEIKSKNNVGRHPSVNEGSSLAPTLCVGAHGHRLLVPTQSVGTRGTVKYAHTSLKGYPCDMR